MEALVSRDLKTLFSSELDVSQLPKLYQFQCALCRYIADKKGMKVGSIKLREWEDDILAVVCIFCCLMKNVLTVA